MWACSTIIINSSLCNKTPAAERAGKGPDGPHHPHPHPSPVIEQLPPCLIYHQWELPLSQFTGTPACCWTLTSIKSFPGSGGGGDEEQKPLAASRRCGLRHSTRSTPLICPSQPGAERRLISSGSEEPGWNANTLHLFPPITLVKCCFSAPFNAAMIQKLINMNGGGGRLVRTSLGTVWNSNSFILAFQLESMAKLFLNSTICWGGGLRMFV